MFGWTGPSSTLVLRCSCGPTLTHLHPRFLHELWIMKISLLTIMWRVTMKKVKVMIQLKKLQHQMTLKELKPDVVEALVCTRDWLFGEKDDLNVAVDNLTQNVMNLNINEDNTEATNSKRTLGCHLVILKKSMLEEEMEIVA
ncbi:unnamed protein product [Lactuca virosa]|uniref:HAT C-terminal dimerisation domain-containing protein n=1 Tax=Lactuca virosa TaxID=75947 RepID=A0AAU9NZN7_9ASTR|nr:unnamed protein product [Lactuca virosa]